MHAETGDTGELLRVDGLSKAFGGVKALDRVGFAIRHGEVLGVIGPNGSGKTTLFECLGGVRPSDAGTVRGDDRDLPVERRSAVVFFVPDGITPWPAQPVRWVLDYAIGYFGPSTQRLPQVVHGLGLEPLLDVPLGALSKGQRKRALLGLGLLTPQPLLMVDEPFDGLDLRQTREVVQTLRTCAAGGRALLLSIHQLADAGRVCDRFVLLNGGRVAAEGTREQLGALAAARGCEATADLEDVFLALT